MSQFLSPNSNLYGMRTYDGLKQKYGKGFSDDKLAEIITSVMNEEPVPYICSPEMELEIHKEMMRLIKDDNGKRRNDNKESDMDG